MPRGINILAKQYKEITLSVFSSFIEPSIWKKFTAAIDHDGYYKIFDHDLPFIRDLKATVNMLTAIESFTESYSLWVVSLVSRNSIKDIYKFYSNFKVYMSTDSEITKSLRKTLNSAWNNILSFSSYLYNMRKHLTSENFEKLGEKFIDGFSYIERFPEEYARKKKRTPEEIAKDEANAGEDALTIIIRKSDEYLKKYLPEMYDAFFLAQPDKKSGKRPERKLLDYYPDNSELPTEKNPHFETINQAKYFLNFIRAVKHSLDLTAEYKKTSILGFSMIKWAKNLAEVLLDVKNYLGKIDPEAVFAEQAQPFAKQIRAELQILNKILEKLACTVDRYESEGLKKGLLTKLVDKIVKRFNQITTDLRIDIDYPHQKRVYYSSRLENRNALVIEIDSQVEKLDEFLQYKNYALTDIPKEIITQLLEFITLFENDISINRDKDTLGKYKEDLQAVLKLQFTVGMLITNPLESLTHKSGLTRHSQVMHALTKMKLSLETLKEIIKEKSNQDAEFEERHPYDFFRLIDLKEQGLTLTILNALKARQTEIAAEMKTLEATAEEHALLRHFTNIITAMTPTKSPSELTTLKALLSKTFSDLKTLEAARIQKSEATKITKLILEMEPSEAPIELNAIKTEMMTHLTKSTLEEATTKDQEAKSNGGLDVLKAALMVHLKEPEPALTKHQLSQLKDTNEKLYFHIISRGFEFCLLKDDKQKLEPGKFYFKKEGEELQYATVTVAGLEARGVIKQSDLKHTTLRIDNLIEPNEREEIFPFLPDILEITTARGHVPKKIIKAQAADEKNTAAPKTIDWNAVDQRLVAYNEYINLGELTKTKLEIIEQSIIESLAQQPVTKEKEAMPTEQTAKKSPETTPKKDEKADNTTLVEPKKISDKWVNRIKAKENEFKFFTTAIERIQKDPNSLPSVVTEFKTQEARGAESIFLFREIETILQATEKPKEPSSTETQDSMLRKVI